MVTISHHLWMEKEEIKDGTRDRDWIVWCRLCARVMSERVCMLLWYANSPASCAALDASSVFVSSLELSIAYKYHLFVYSIQPLSRMEVSRNGGDLCLCSLPHLYWQCQYKPVAHMAVSVHGAS